MKLLVIGLVPMPWFATPISGIRKFLSFLVKGILNGACDGVSFQFPY